MARRRLRHGEIDTGSADRLYSVAPKNIFSHRQRLGPSWRYHRSPDSGDHEKTDASDDRRVEEQCTEKDLSLNRDLIIHVDIQQGEA